VDFRGVTRGYGKLRNEELQKWYWDHEIEMDEKGWV
jgi:hypothetical protein